MGRSSPYRLSIGILLRFYVYHPHDQQGEDSESIYSKKVGLNKANAKDDLKMGNNEVRYLYIYAL